MGNVFTTPIHYQVPERYITQTMFEQRATGASLGTIYMSWSPECCTVFLVLENKTLCDNIISEIQNVYFSIIPKRPSQLSDHSKQIKQDLIAASRTCTFLGEFPSVKGFISELSNSKMNENSESPYVLPVMTSNSTERITFDDILKSLISGKEIVNEAYELQRQMASQVVVVLLADLDRLWKSEEPHAVPVMYFSRGYSLSMEIMRQLMEKCKDECKRNGIDITACSADGEFLQLMVRGKNNQPLTMHQLSKDIWAETNRLTKSQLIRKCIDASKLYSCTKNRISRIGLDKTERVVVSIEVKSDNVSVSNIRTPVKGWKNLKKPSKESPEMLELSEMNDNIPNPNGNSPEPVLSDDDVIQTALLSATTERTENEASAARTPDLDETICYNVEDFSSLENDKSKVVLNEKDISDILHLLQTSNERKWSKVKTSELSKYFSSAVSLKKFIVKEVIEITKFLKVKPEVAGKQLNLGKGITKIDLVNQLSQLVCDGSKLEKRVKRSRLKTVSSLKELAARAITKKQYPKEVLAIALCEYIWPQRVREWRQSSKVADKIQINGLDETFEPYYVPEFYESTQEFNVFVYDKTHLGSNLRKAICVNKVEGISKKSWEKVASQNPELLNPVLLEVSEEGKIIDQMKEKLAKNMFSSLVEEQMTNGDEREANFCGIIRNALYIADDEPGISSLDRCRKRLAFINWLQEDVDFGKFPPYGARIKGLSYILYEGLRSSQEAKLYLYALAKQGTYCVRAPNTLCSESFFSTMQEMDPWGQGVLTTTGVRKHIKEFTTITALKMKEDRCFSIKTKKDAAYPMPSLPEGGLLFSDKASMCDCRRMKYISCIEPRDHFFDSRERARTKLSSLNEPTRGDLPIRSRYGYKINEAKILPSKRLGIKLDTF